MTHLYCLFSLHSVSRYVPRSHKVSQKPVHSVRARLLFGATSSFEQENERNMAARATASTTAQAAINAGARASWLPMIIILLAQIQMAFNVNALPVSIGPIVETLDTPATMVGTALVVYSLVCGRLRHAGRQARQALWRAARLPSYGHHSRPGDGTDGDQPRRPRDDRRPGAGRPGRRRACAYARRAGCGELSRRSASPGIGPLGRGAGHGRRPGVSDCRLSWYGL